MCWKKNHHSYCDSKEGYQMCAMDETRAWEAKFCEKNKLFSNNNTDIWASQEREKSVDLKSFWRKLVAIFGEEWSWQKLASIAEQIVTATFRNSALHLFTDVGQKFQQKYWTALVIIIRYLYTLKNLIHLRSCVMILII